jgi:hypothetical protein
MFVDWRIILKLMSKKCSVRLWTVFIWHKRKYSGRLCANGNELLHSLSLEKFLTCSVDMKFPGEYSISWSWLSLL